MAPILPTDDLIVNHFWVAFFFFCPQTTKEMIARSCATIVTHPFHGTAYLILFDFKNVQLKTVSRVLNSLIILHYSDHP